jgi:hypothetical protein
VGIVFHVIFHVIFHVNFHVAFHIIFHVVSATGSVVQIFNSIRVQTASISTQIFTQIAGSVGGGHAVHRLSIAEFSTNSTTASFVFDY